MVAAVRKFLIFVLIVVVVAAGIGVFLIVTTPRQSAGVRSPLGERELALMAHVPESADSFAVIPTAAALHRKLRANPITQSAIESWKVHQPLPRPWMVGSADLLAWKSGKETRYFARLDLFRAVVVKMFVRNGTLINSTAEPPIDTSALSSIVALASKLPPGDALVVQRQTSRGAYPSIRRPAVTSVQVSDSEIVLTSVAAAAPGGPAGETPAPAQFPRSAILSASFAAPPRLIGDLNRLFGAKISALLENGGSVAVYGIDTRKLLPRPLGVIALPAERRPDFESFVRTLEKAEAIGVRVRTAERGNSLLLSFDDSIDQYLKDGFDAPSASGNSWSMRVDPQRLVPILNDLVKSLGLRVVAPRLFRSARDLDEWIGGLERAKTIEATDSVDSGVETLRVRITAK